MNNKSIMTIVTLISAFLFSMVIVFVSLSPLSELGPNANQFNSTGMWLSIAMIVMLYAVPLVIYHAGVNWMKYLMAVLSFLGLFTMVAIMITATIIGMTALSLSAFYPLLGMCALYCLANISWYLAAFPRNKQASAMAKSS
ncbi:DUF5391 family protein [Sutcliffiella horikoshii]|uniref:DUF5391 family protein n=1 Tax=Sutcliffiella horikoshii TaxID=79883 RepID=UPI001F295280|nr:DUF5391 family protein [Sutcliffiella horikoshii]MCG1021755.1 hypothetical protein [Sutcliffiella horikoshii]